MQIATPDFQTVLLIIHQNMPLQMKNSIFFFGGQLGATPSQWTQLLAPNQAFCIPEFYPYLHQWNNAYCHRATKCTKLTAVYCDIMNIGGSKTASILHHSIQNS